MRRRVMAQLIELSGVGLIGWALWQVAPALTIGAVGVYLVLLAAVISRGAR